MHSTGIEDVPARARVVVGLVAVLVLAGGPAPPARSDAGRRRARRRVLAESESPAPGPPPGGGADPDGARGRPADPATRVATADFVPYVGSYPHRVHQGNPSHFGVCDHHHSYTGAIDFHMPIGVDGPVGRPRHGRLREQHLRGGRHGLRGRRRPLGRRPARRRQGRRATCTSRRPRCRWVSGGAGHGARHLGLHRATRSSSTCTTTSRSRSTRGRPSARSSPATAAGSSSTPTCWATTVVGRRALRLDRPQRRLRLRRLPVPRRAEQPPLLRRDRVAHRRGHHRRGTSTAPSARPMSVVRQAISAWLHRRAACARSARSATRASRTCRPGHLFDDRDLVDGGHRTGPGLRRQHLPAGALRLAPGHGRLPVPRGRVPRRCSVTLGAVLRRADRPPLRPGDHLDGRRGHHHRVHRRHASGRATA